MGPQADTHAFSRTSVRFSSYELGLSQHVRNARGSPSLRRNDSTLYPKVYLDSLPFNVPLLHSNFSQNTREHEHLVQQSCCEAFLAFLEPVSRHLLDILLRYLANCGPTLIQSLSNPTAARSLLTKPKTCRTKSWLC